MPTSVHIPPALLAAVDRRAKALAMSRNRLIVRALEREVAGDEAWSPQFFAALADVDDDTVRGVDELLAAVVAARSSKKPGAGPL